MRIIKVHTNNETVSILLSLFHYIHSSQYNATNRKLNTVEMHMQYNYSKNQEFISCEQSISSLVILVFINNVRQNETFQNKGVCIGWIISENEFCRNKKIEAGAPSISSFERRYSQKEECFRRDLNKDEICGEQVYRSCMFVQEQFVKGRGLQTGELWMGWSFRITYFNKQKTGLFISIDLTQI